MPKRLVINSDDYGRTPEISRGIRETHLNGVLTSTTCMLNIPTTAHDIALAVQQTPRLGLGVHLVLTMGRPILPPEAVPSLVDANGNHRKYDAFVANLPHLSIAEVKAEWRAQIEAFLRAAGRKPTHLDSHHHSSYFTPELFRAMLELAREYNCPIRNPMEYRGAPTAGLPNTEQAMREQTGQLLQEFKPRTTDLFFAGFYDEEATLENLLSLLNQAPAGTAEIMCHPGYVDEAFARESAYNFQRERELKILTDPAVRQAVRDCGLELINFSDL